MDIVNVLLLLCNILYLLDFFNSLSVSVFGKVIAWLKFAG